jgi:hypothetical protein
MGCLIVNGNQYGATGTSSCLMPYDPIKQELRTDRAQVVISGKVVGTIFYSASVPHLLVFGDNLYLYWSTITVDRANQGKFVRVAVYGVQLEADSNGLYWAKGVGHIVHTMDPPTVEVWKPDDADPMSNTAVDLKSVWAHGNEIIMVGSLGGEGCATPDGKQPGCWRMAIAKASRPIDEDIFNQSPRLHESELPTNPMDYTRPIRDPSGGYSFMGDSYKPVQNGYSEQRPAPADWSKLGTYDIIIFPFLDRNLWPTQ